MHSIITLYCIIGLLLFSSTCVLTPVAADSVANTDTASGVLCQPWKPSPACKRNQPLSLRFMLGLSPAYLTGSSASALNYTVYSFAPNVDSLQSFTLKGAGLMAAGGVDSNNKPYIYTPVPSVNLSIYGFGDADAREYPLPNTKSTVLAATQSADCGSLTSVLLASNLMLEIGLHKGVFNYLATTTNKYQWVNNTNYNETLCALYNSSTSAPTNLTNLTNITNSTPNVDYCSQRLWVINGTYQLPAKTGFVPTCTLNKDMVDVCTFDSESPCIGAVPGQKNCAKCYTNATALANANIQVWTSYFGSDYKSVTLLSGGTNPMTYYKFAGSDIFSNIASQLDAATNTVANETGKINISWWGNLSF